MGLLVRHALGGTLRRVRMDQGRTLREVATDARVSVGYLSEVERGHKEASSELLTSICGALEVPVSDVLIDAGDILRSDELIHAASEVTPTTAQAQSRRRRDEVSPKFVIPNPRSMAVV